MLETRRPQVHIRRKGRMTKGQARAISERADHYRLGNVDECPRPIMIEIGFGMGHALVEFAVQHGGWTCIGVDVYQPGIGSLILQCDSQGLRNVRILEADIRQVLPTFAAQSVRLVTIYFPDPWPKSRHRKRRLVQAPFAAAVARVLEPGGRLLVATDWEAYASAMLDVLDAEPALENEAGAGSFTERTPEERPVTHFEKRGRARGHAVWDLAYRKI